MYLASISIDYKNPPSRFPDRFYLSVSDKLDLHKILLNQKNINVAIIIQTFNRFEIIFTDITESEGVFESIRNKELEKAIFMLGGVIEPRIKEVLEGFSKSLMKKLMHNFLSKVRENPLDAEELGKFTNLFVGNADLPSNQS